MRRAIVLGALAPLLAASPAHAGWTAPALVSATATEQAQPSAGADTDRGSDSPVISADGRYVAFRTGARNLVDTPEPDPAFFRRGGIVRKNLDTGDLELVAPGARYPSAGGPKTRAGATRPSISADGRWVAFQTDDPLVAGDTNTVTDVYLRDMRRPPADPGAYILVSALDGTGDVPVYGTGASAGIAAVGAALSADGTKVLFTAGPSDLPAGGGPTPADQTQLFVRDVPSQRTTLVTARRDLATGAMTDLPAGQGVPDAQLSADGTTALWTAPDASTLARIVAGTPEERPSLVVRRIGDGPAAPAQRVAGIDDPRDPACRSGGSISSVSGPLASPCDGPFAQRSDIQNDPFAPPYRISPDGRAVTFKSAYPLRTDSDIERTRNQQALFAADLTVSGKAGVRRTLASSLDDFLATADARTWVIGVTGVPTLPVVGPTPTSAVARELYSVDVATGNAELITRRVEGTLPRPGGGPLAPSISADGSRVVFQSEQSDLVAADGNGERDVFIAFRTNDAPDPAGQVLPAAPGPVQLRPLRKLRVTALPLKDGRVRLTITVPSAGRVAATARASTGGRRARTVATTAASPRIAGPVRRYLRLSTATRRRVGRRGLAVSVRVSFRSPGARTALTRTITTTFRQPAKTKKRGA